MKKLSSELYINNPSSVSSTLLVLLLTEKLSNVMYVFGPRLPSHGRCISVSGELDRINKRSGEFTAYLIEVCISCGWNHMIRSTTLGKY